VTNTISYDRAHNKNVETQCIASLQNEC